MKIKSRIYRIEQFQVNSGTMEVTWSWTVFKVENKVVEYVGHGKEHSPQEAVNAAARSLIEFVKIGQHLSR